MKGRTSVAALVGLLVVVAASYSSVSPTNFSGWDEWLVIDLTSRGIVSLAYNNRPFSLLFGLPGSLLTPNGLIGFWLVHGLYFCCTATAVFLLARRLAPGRAGLAFSAAAVSASWAPLDSMRLDAVLLTNYSGVTAAATLAVLVLVEAWRSRSRVLLLLALGLALLALRTLESCAGLLLAAPALLWTLPVPPDAQLRRARRSYALAWTGVAAVGVALAARPLLPGAPASYQTSGLGFDPHPLHVLARLARQLTFQLEPLLHPGAGDWRTPSIAVALVAFLGVGLWQVRGDDRAGSGRESEARAALRLAAVGLAATVLGYSVLLLSSSMRGPQRMQILSAPGIGLLLAGALALGTSWLRTARRGPAALVLAAFVVGLGSARTAALQRQWNETSAWPAQRASLAGVVHAAPGLAAGTLVVLLDDSGAWPAGFTFRHAMRFLYGAPVVAVAWGAEDFLYRVRIGTQGVAVTPYESIREPWQVRPTLHPFETIVVLRGLRGGTVGVLEEWPVAELGALPAGASYAPRRRIQEAPARPQRAILDWRGLGSALPER